MLFNSIEFLIFFPIVTILYYNIDYKYRWFLLLIASCIFYMAFIPQYILILFFTILIDYFAGILIEDTNKKEIKKKYLIISIISTCIVLFIFKYFNFFNSNFSYIANFFNLNYPIPMLNIILPIGLSFHTFQSLSYVIEVYRGNQKAERNFGIYSLYVMFYPQLVAGPIERPQNLLHQFYEKHDFNYKDITDGLKLMAWGAFKKIVIADKISQIINPVYENPTNYTGLSLIVSTFLFSYQIYCDFSGYSDIARGSAQVMGFRLMKNFNKPYFSKSISEFWTRWHISLSTWFKDYLYIPLGGNKVSKSRWILNLFLTFLISGLWHGANWTYIIWGALNGFYLSSSIITINIRNKLLELFKIDKFHKIHNFFRVFITFSLISFSWIFFRAESIEDSFYIISHLFKDWDNNFNIYSYIRTLDSDLGKSKIFICILLILFLEFIHIVQEKKGSIRDIISQKPTLFRWAIYYIFMFVFLFLGEFNSTDFIYFNF
ncbi:MAG: MBOAT family O-acyltransferase [Candidatus Sericytochromatia bacterium]